MTASRGRKPQRRPAEQSPEVSPAERGWLYEPDPLRKRLEPLDLKTIQLWLELCGPCDAGVAARCTCPQGDYRRPLLALYREVERLRALLAKVGRS